MKKKISLLTWLGTVSLAFVFFASSCGASKQAVTPQMVDGSYAAKEKALLWKIMDKKQKNPSYLFGTIHMISEKDYFMPSYVEKAFNSSESIVFEINTEEMTDMSMMGSMMDMMFMKETTLKDLLSEEDYKRVKANINENPMMMMMGDMVDKIKPLFLSAIIDQGDMGGDPMGGGGLLGGGGSTLSYELEFTGMAKEAEKPISGLETVEFQMSMFDSISLEDQAQMLVQSLDAEAKEDGKDALTMMVNLYKDQDVPGLYELIHVQAAESSDFEDKLLTMRNKNWIPKMADMMKEQTTFFAVGAGHLGGEEGVIALLRKEGYIVVPVLK